MDRVSGPIDRLVGVDVADQLAGGLFSVHDAGIGRGDLVAALRDADDVLHPLRRAASLRTRRRRSSCPSATVFCLASTCTLQSGHGSPVKRLAAKNSIWPGRGLRHQADVRHDDDRVGAQQVVDGFDDVDAGLLEVDGHAPDFGVAMVRQQLAPRRHELIGVEQRHLREGVDVQHHALRDFRLVVLQRAA